MDNVACRHVSRRGDRRGTGPNRPVGLHPRLRLLVDDGTAGACDGGSDAPAMEQLGVGGVDNDVNLLGGDVPLNHRNLRHTAKLPTLAGSRPSRSIWIAKRPVSPVVRNESGPPTPGSTIRCAWRATARAVSERPPHVLVDEIVDVRSIVLDCLG